MSYDPQQPVPPVVLIQPEPPPRKRGWGCLLGGCLSILLMMVLACGGFAWYASRKAVELVHTSARQMVEQSELPPEEKQAVLEQVDRVAAEYQAGRIGMGKVMEIFEQLRDSPLFSAFMAHAAIDQYVEPSQLSAEEKQQARRTLERTARGVFEAKITWEEVESAADPLSTVDEQGNRQFKEQVSDDELRQFLAACRELADSHEIPDEPFEIRVGEEVRRAVDKVLQDEG